MHSDISSYLAVYVAPAVPYFDYVAGTHLFFLHLSEQLSPKTRSASAKGRFDAHFTGGDTA